MSTEKTQSQIKEVRDQMSLDFSDGRYLNTISTNLGIARPRIGLSDSEWRAIVKAIALHYKQVRTAFAAVLSIFFGPRITVGTALSQDAVVGDTSIFVLDTREFPQVGTIVIDEGLGTEETVEYCYIDRTTGEMFLETALTQNHTALLSDAETNLLFDVPNGSNSLIVEDISQFPDLSPFVNYPIIVGAGTVNEEVLTVSAVDHENLTLTTSAINNTRLSALPSSIRTTVARDYSTITTPTVLTNNSSLLLTVADASQFPETGTVILSALGPKTISASVFTANGGSTSTITVPTISAPDLPILANETHAGHRVVFEPDTTTAALRNIEVTVLTNTETSITLVETLPAAVVSGDTFKIRPVVSYFNVDYDTNVLSLNKVITDVLIEDQLAVHTDTAAAGSDSLNIVLTTGGLTANEFRGYVVQVGTEQSVISSHSSPADTLVLSTALMDATPAGSTVIIYESVDVELLSFRETVHVGQVKSVGTGWDIFQTDPLIIDVQIPEDLVEERDSRSGGYIHTTYDSTIPNTTLASGVTAGDSFFLVSDPTDFPIVGVAILDAGGGNQENVAYFNPRSVTTDFNASGSTTLVVENSSLFGNSGSIILAENTAIQETVTISDNNEGTNTLTVSSLTNTHYTGTLVRSVQFNVPNSTLANTHSGGTSVDLYQPFHLNSSLPFNLIPPFGTLTQGLDGNAHLIDDVFYGPYMYRNSGSMNPEVLINAPAFGTGSTTLSELLPGPTRMAIDQQVGSITLEVENATAFDLTNFPYSVRVGAGTGNLETVSVADISLKQRTSTSVSVATAGSSVITTTGLLDTSSGISNGIADSFPVSTDYMGYRIVIDKDGSNEEVAYVVSAAGSDLTLESPLVSTHVSGERILLMSDVLVLSSATADDHEGIVGLDDRTVRWPVLASSDFNTAESVSPLLSGMLINDVTGFSETGDDFYLNFSGVLKDVKTSIVGNPAGGSTSIVVDSVVGLPDFSITDFIITIAPGALVEENMRVIGVNPGTNTLTLASRTLFDHTDNTPVVFEASGMKSIVNTQEFLTYNSISGNTLSFSFPIVLQFNHSPGESAVVSKVDSEPRDNGFDFPFILTPEASFRVATILDLVRAAGVNIRFS